MNLFEDCPLKTVLVRQNFCSQQSSLNSYVYRSALFDLNQSSTTSTNLPWQPPPVDMYKVNVDGAISNNSLIGSCGGVIRDHRGNWIVGFTQSLGRCSAFEAEEWAIYKGMLIAWELGLKNIIIESDAKELVEIIHRRQGSDSGSLILMKILQMLNYNWSVTVQFIQRDRNSLADALAKVCSTSTIIHTDCLMHLRAVYSKESLGFNPHVD